MPFVFPCSNDNSSRQGMYGSPIYTSLPIYPSTGGHAHPAFGYNAFYSTFYPTSTNMISSAAHLNDVTPLMAPRSLMYAAPSLIELSRDANETQRKKSLTIGECSSLVITEVEGEKHRPETVPSNDSHANEKLPTSSLSSASLGLNLGKRNCWIRDFVLILFAW